MASSENFTGMAVGNPTRRVVGPTSVRRRRGHGRNGARLVGAAAECQALRRRLEIGGIASQHEQQLAGRDRSDSAPSASVGPAACGRAKPGTVSLPAANTMALPAGIEPNDAGKCTPRITGVTAEPGRNDPRSLKFAGGRRPRKYEGGLNGMGIALVEERQRQQGKIVRQRQPSSRDIDGALRARPSATARSRSRCTRRPARRPA